MDVATALGTYLTAVDSAAPGMIEGLYVVGSFALDDWRPGRSDIDIVATTAEPATDADFAALRTAHALLTEHQPLPHIDGPYLAWTDLTAAPATGLHRPWTLDGELHHDGDCFEINPVTWYTLATYGVTVRGPTMPPSGGPARGPRSEILTSWTKSKEEFISLTKTLLPYWGPRAGFPFAPGGERSPLEPPFSDWWALARWGRHTPRSPVTSP